MVIEGIYNALNIHFMKGPEYYATVVVIVYQSCIQKPFLYVFLIVYGYFKIHKWTLHSGYFFEEVLSIWSLWGHLMVPEKKFLCKHLGCKIEMIICIIKG